MAVLACLVVPSVLAAADSTLSILEVSPPSTVSQRQMSVAVTMSVTNTGSTTATFTSSGLVFRDLSTGSVSSQYTVTPASGNPTKVSSGASAVLTFLVSVDTAATTGAIQVAASLEAVDEGTTTTSNLSGSGEVFLFGGSVSGTTTDESWLYRGASWFQLGPSSKPSARENAAVAYDALRGRLVLFGGLTGSGRSDETWEWDGFEWEKKSPGSKPSARQGARMAYDWTRARSVLFGGNDGSNDNETWEWDGTDWTEASPSSVPSARTNHVLTYDASRQRVVLFSGSGGNDETWEFDGADWAKQSPATNPGSLLQHAMVYDEARSVSTLFGGLEPGFGGKDETWTWNGTNWIEKFPASSPSARTRHGMASDLTRNKIVLFSGSGGLDETWEWDGSQWNEASPAQKPLARFDHAMAYFQAATTWTVVTPPAFSIGQVSVSTTTVVQGQSALSVSFTVENTGSQIASFTSSGLTFRAGVTDVTSQYTSTPLGTNSTSLASGATTTLGFLVDIDSGATDGPVSIDATVAGTSTAFGVSTADSTADTTASWTVIIPPTFSVRTVAVTSGTVAQGQPGVPVSFTVENTGSRPGTFTSSGLKFTAGMTDVTSEYTLTPLAANPLSVEGGTTTTVQFRVDVAAGATLGAVSIDASAAGTSTFFGTSTSDSAADTTTSWTVVTPPAFSVRQVSAADTTIVQGQTGREVRFTVENTGSLAATFTASGLKFSSGMTDVTSEYTVTSVGANPASLAAGATTTLSFVVDAGGSATLGTVSIDASAAGTSTDFGVSTSDGAADTTTSWTVATPPTFSVRQVTVTTGVVAQGQTGLSVSFTVENTGSLAGTFTSSGVKLLSGGPTDLTSQFTVTPLATNPTSLSAGATTTLQFILDVGAAATAGALSVEGTVAGTNTAFGVTTADGAADTPASWTVVTPPSFSIRQVTPSTTTVVQTQSGLTLDVTVENTGSRPGTITSSSVRMLSGMTDVTSEYTLAAAGSNPGSIAGGATATLAFSAEIASGATLGAISLDASVAGTSTAFGLSTSDGAADTPGSWTVTTPPSFSVRQVSATSATVAQRQTAVRVDFTVENTGSQSATFTASGLKFTSGMTDVTSEYTITSLGDNPEVVAGGATATLGFLVDVSSGATLGAVSIDASAAGTSTVFGVSTSDADADTADSWTVVTPPAFSVREVSATSSTVAQGQSGLAVSVTVENTGSQSATLTASGLKLMSGSTDVASEYTVTALDTNPASIAGATTATLEFLVDVGSAATLGAVSIDASAAGTSTVFGVSTSDTDADTTHTWTVVTPPIVSVRQVSSTSTTVAQGQARVAVSFTVENTGSLSATFTSSGLKFSSGSTDVTSEYVVTALSTNPASIATGATVPLTFAVDISSAATLGTVSIDASAAGTNTLFGVASSDGAADTATSWTVVTPPAFSVRQVSATSSTVARGQSALVVSFTIENTGSQSATFTSSGLKFLSGATDVTSDYSVTPRADNPASIDGGATETLGFTVGVASTATLGAVSIDASAAGTSTVFGLSSSDEDADTTDSWTVVTPPAFFIRQVTPSASQVAQGQTGLSVAFTVENTGSLPGTIVTSSLLFQAAGPLDVTTGFTVAPAASNPDSVAAGAVETLTFSVAVDTAANLGVASIDGSIAGTNTTFGVSTADEGADSPGAWNVLTPPDFRITAMTASKAVISQGQSGLSVSVTVQNLGQAAASVTTVGLSFASGSSDVTTQYVVALGTNPPTQLLGETSGDFQFDVAAVPPPDSTTGTIGIGAFVQGAGFSLTTDDTTASLASWRLLKAADLQILGVSGPQIVSRGESFVATLTLFNAGESLAEVLSADIGWGNEGLDSTAREDNPTSVAGGAAAEFLFDVTVSLGTDLTASPQTLTATAAASWRDELSRLTFSTSSSAAGSVPVLNVPPVASFTAQATATLADTVALDGSASSDAESPAGLSYSWSFVSVPAGSALTTSSITPNDSDAARQASFQPDRRGVHVISLVVRDSFDSSDPVTRAVEIINRDPVAVAVPPDQPVERNAPARLDGSGSSDPDGDPLAYLWSFAASPPATGSGLTGAAFSPNGTSGASSTEFTPDVTGTFAVGLSVDDGQGGSASTLTQVQVILTPPVARIGEPAATARRADPITLDGSASTSSITTDLVYRWRFVSQPAGSTLTSGSLSPNDSTTATTAVFRPDRKGVHEVQLVVDDGRIASDPASVVVTVLNSAPSVSVAEAPAQAPVAAPFTLSATASDLDPEDVLTYTWSVRSAPGGAGPAESLSFSVNGTTGAASTSFTPAVPGDYGFRVSVDDGDGGTAAAETTVTVTNDPPVARISTSDVLGGPRIMELDGSGSSDPEGEALTHAWMLKSAPAGALGLTTSTAAIEYMAFLPGDYTFVLTVADPHLAVGEAEATLLVDTQPPATDAGPPQTLILPRSNPGGSVPLTLAVTLDGTGTTDDHEENLTYRWELSEAPDLEPGTAGTSDLASLEDATSPRARLRLSLATDGSGALAPFLAAGRYRVRLTASDGASATTDVVRIRAIDPDDLPPVAHAGSSRRVTVTFGSSGALEATIPDPIVFPRIGLNGEPLHLRDFIRLDGRESADPRGRPITYTWTVAQRPAGAAATQLLDSTTALPRLRPTREGLYRLRLVVSNGSRSSEPVEIDLRVTADRPLPTAVAEAEDLIRLRRSSRLRPVLAFQAGERIVLDGEASLNASHSTSPPLVYAWRQTGGSVAALEPSTASEKVSFITSRPGLYSFDLTVTDATGTTDDAALSVLVLPAAAGDPADRRPSLSITASASTTTLTGTSLPEGGIDLTNRKSLRVTVPATVTLSASFDYDADLGSSAIVTWRQLEGPTVILSNTGEEGITKRTSVTRFSPTTSRVHVFEARIDLVDGAGKRTGVRAARRIRVVVDTTDSSVPEATVTLSRTTIALGGTETDRTILLEGTGATAVARPGQSLSYIWEQLTGPPGTFSDPFGEVTQFIAPPVSGTQQTIDYIFRFTVDTNPPGDRSEPFVFRIAQAQTAGGPQGSNVGGGGGGGGCAFAPPGTPSVAGLPGAALFVLLLGGGLLRRRRRGARAQ